MRPSIRSAGTGLSDSETTWLQKRRGVTTSALRDFFGHVPIPGFDAASFIDRNAHNVSLIPNIGIALSGGGYRALTNGAGSLKAFDNRTKNSTVPGQLGGLLQASTYVAGLSGGSWLVGSVFINNFSTIDSLQTHDSGDVWQFSQSILEGPDGSSIQVIDSATYYHDITDAVDAKNDAGFQTSITDYWYVPFILLLLFSSANRFRGRALAFQLIHAANGGVNFTWSSIALDPGFAQGNIPMPIIVSDDRYQHTVIVGSNSTVYEFNPFEFGTWDPTIFGFAPTEFLGSNFSGGILPEDQMCVRGYDNAGFIMGSSSTLFNEPFIVANSSGMNAILKAPILAVLRDIGRDNDDVAIYGPNAFFGYNNMSNPNYNSSTLSLVDGGEDGENVPLQPLIQPERALDVIFAVDSSADTNNTNWPAGLAMISTYERSLNVTGIGNHTSFPAVPDTNTFINLGLNNRPTFFGCDSRNTTTPTPLIVYLPNAPYSYHSNISTFTDTYEDTQRDAVILNGYNVATMGNNSLDPNWTTCVGCAILSRSLEKTNTPVPSACTNCFSRYCWNGALNSTPPTGDYLPPLKVKPYSAASIPSPSKFFAVVAVVVATVFAVM